LITFITALAQLYLPEGVADRRGQSLVEYALIIVLIAIAVIVAITALGGQLNSVFGRITASLNTGG
jgi:pilus assembly protein Flp/PilA